MWTTSLHTLASEKAVLSRRQARKMIYIKGCHHISGRPSSVSMTERNGEALGLHGTPRAQTSVHAIVLSHRILSVCNLNMAIFDPSLGILALRLESDTRMNTIPVPYQPSQTRAERRCWGSWWQHIERQRKSAEKSVRVGATSHVHHQPRRRPLPLDASMAEDRPITVPCIGHHQDIHLASSL